MDISAYCCNCLYSIQYLTHPRCFQNGLCTQCYPRASKNPCSLPACHRYIKTWSTKLHLGISRIGITVRRVDIETPIREGNDMSHASWRVCRIHVCGKLQSMPITLHHRPMCVVEASPRHMNLCLRFILFIHLLLGK